MSDPAPLDAGVADGGASRDADRAVDSLDTSLPSDVPRLDAAWLDVRASDDVTDVAATPDIADVADAPPDDTSPPALPPLEDFSLGPYPSAVDILLRSLPALAERFDSARTFTHAAAQGYVLQAFARTLQAARGRALPGGEASRDALLTLALGECDELARGARRVRGGALGYGLDYAWDAFSDGSVNPAYTNYAWQTGMVATGVGEVLLYLRDAGTRHADRAAEVTRLTAFLEQLVRPWASRSTVIAGASPAAEYYWYSFERADAKNVHNTNALIATATWMLGELIGDDALRARARAGSEALRVRLRSGRRGYVWSYVDDGYPAERRVPEDISHALLTTQFLRFARDRGWLTDAHMAGVSRTFLGQVWSGNPARLHGRVDGSSGGADEWTWTRAAVLGMAAHADAPGGDPSLFDYARSVFVSARLAADGAPLRGASVDAVGADALATLLSHRPAAYAPDTRWSVVAGPGDDRPPARADGGVRFYTIDWGPPSMSSAGGLSLTARRATATNANLVVDLPAAPSRAVAVSITWLGDADAVVSQWDGSAYRARATLPATRGPDGAPRWMRSTWTLTPAAAFDYQPGVPGVNVLFQVSARVAVHRVEATPL